MPSVQDTYNRNISGARAGFIANQEGKILISRTVEDVEAIPFGRIVKQGANDGGCTATLTGLDAQNFLGITAMDRGVRPTSPNGFARYDSARILRKGVIWVQVGEAVTPASVPTVTLASGVIGDTAVGAGVAAIPNARFEGSTTGAGLVKLRLD